MPKDKNMSDLLTAHLADRDVPCPNCAYNLRGLTSDRCPECDQQIEVGVNLTEPAVGALIALMAPLWTLGGGGVVFTIVVLLVSAAYRDLPPLEVFIVPGVAAVFGCMSAWRVGHKPGRMWFRSLRRQRQVLIVAASWTALVLTVIIFTVHLLIVM